MASSDYEERKFISFVKEFIISFVKQFIYKNIIFHCDFICKRTDICSLILHVLFKLLRVYVLKEFKKFNTIIIGTEVINESFLNTRLPIVKNDFLLKAKEYVSDFVYQLL